MSQDAFQQKNQILMSCPGCIDIADDVAVFGRDAREHNKNLHNGMQVARQHGLVSKADKCELKQERIKFFGLYFYKEGVHPDPEKVLLQDGKPVAFCSKALTDCEKRYANIEREMLDVVYGY